MAVLHVLTVLLQGDISNIVSPQIKLHTAATEYILCGIGGWPSAKSRCEEFIGGSQVYVQALQDTPGVYRCGYQIF